MPRTRTRHPIVHAVLLLAIAAVACVDGPFARQSPVDPGSDFELNVVGVRDTVTAVGDWALFYLQSNWQVQDPTAEWSSSHPQYVIASGAGAFRLQTLPATTTVVTVSVAVYERVVTAPLVILR